MHTFYAAIFDVFSCVFAKSTDSLSSIILMTCPISNSAAVETGEEKKEVTMSKTLHSSAHKSRSRHCVHLCVWVDPILNAYSLSISWVRLSQVNIKQIESTNGHIIHQCNVLYRENMPNAIFTHVGYLAASSQKDTAHEEVAAEAKCARLQRSKY